MVARSPNAKPDRQTAAALAAAAALNPALVRETLKKVGSGLERMLDSIRSIWFCGEVDVFRRVCWVGLGCAG
jgi:hypothetical protein